MNDSPQLKLLLKRPRAILFDYDGVLVASEPIHLSAWTQLLAELNLPNDTELILKSVGKTAPEILSRLLDRYKPGWNHAEYDVHALAQRKNLFYISLAEIRLKVYPGVKDGIAWLHTQNIGVAIVSNGRRREIDKTMKLLGLSDLVSEVVSRDDVIASKPDPMHYLFGAATLGVDPQDCLAVEDSPTGLESALLAKIPAAGILTNFPRNVLEAPVPGRPDLRPIWIGESMVEFFQWLKTLPK
jgi:beta-phosphoglucomutase